LWALFWGLLTSLTIICFIRLVAFLITRGPPAFKRWQLCDAVARKGSRWSAVLAKQVDRIRLHHPETLAIYLSASSMEANIRPAQSLTAAFQPPDRGRADLGSKPKKPPVQRFAEAERITVIAEYVEVETGKGADALDRRPESRRRTGAGAKGKMPDPRRQARSAQPGRAFHQRIDGAPARIHCC
jgi:hypothetical protein